MTARQAYGALGLEAVVVALIAWRYLVWRRP